MDARRDNSQYSAALEVVRALRGAGHAAYFAGGCVRDMLLGIAPKDYDVATAAVPEQIVALFAKTFTVGAHFGVVLVCVPQEDAPDVAIEVATFRHDGAYTRWAAAGCGALLSRSERGCAAAGLHDQWAAARSDG